MSIFSRFRPKPKNIVENMVPEPKEVRKSKFYKFLSYGSGPTYNSSKALGLSAVSRCVELISDSVSQLPLEVYSIDSKGYKQVDPDNEIGIMLNDHINPRMSSAVFFKTFTSSVLIKGEAYGYIERDTKGTPIAIHYLPTEYVTVQVPEYLNQPLEYTITGVKDRIQEKDMIHVFWATDDGISAISVLDRGKDVLELSYKCEAHAKRFFESGSLFGLLKCSGLMTDDQKKHLKDTWNSSQAGTSDMNGVCVLDQSFTYEPISVSPENAQLLQSREYQTVEIGRLFGVSPSKLFASTNSVSYNSLEQENLSFLSSCLNPILYRIEKELDRKIFPERNMSVRFDTTALLRSDSTSLANTLKTNVSFGIMSLNEARLKLNLPAVPNGDSVLVPANMLTLNNAVKNTPANSAIKSEEEIVTEKKED